MYQTLKLLSTLFFQTFGIIPALLRYKYYQKGGDEMIEWLLSNQEWVFSGIGVASIAAILHFIRLRIKQTSNMPIKNEKNIPPEKKNINIIIRISSNFR